MSLNPPSDWFGRWVSHHCESTAAGPEASRMLELARETFLGDWQADEIELLECTRRLIAGMRVPKFGNEHSDAVGRELIDMRSERERRNLERGDPAAESCHLCGGSGWVEVPHPRCVWNGQLALHPTIRRVAIASVTCDCHEGRRQKRCEDVRAEKAEEGHASSERRLSLEEYTQRVRGADGVGMLAVYRRRQVESARADGESPFAGIVKSILAKMGAARA